jgi:hypothetical protein
MDREYFQQIEESSSSALRITSRTITVTACGMISVYVLSIALPALLPGIV